MATNIRLRVARMVKGLTQLQLAEKVGRKEIDISRIETGRLRPPPEIKEQIAAVLQQPAYELFDA